MDANQVMQYLLSSFENHEKPDGDWYIESALRKLPWQTQFDSLKALDALFASYRKKYPNPDPKAFLAKTNKRNSLLLISAYVAKVLSHATHTEASWYSYEDFVATNPTEHQYMPHTFGTSMILQLGGQWILPISLVCDQFFEQDVGMPLSVQIENLILNHQWQHCQNTTAWMHLLQKMVIQQAPLAGGLAHADLIANGQHQWDYSIASLQHMDALLYKIRNEKAFHTKDQQLDSGQVNFIFWAGAYLASTVANLTENPVYWWNHEEFGHEIGQDVPVDINHLRIAQFGEHWHFILGFVADYLLGNTSTSVPQYVHSIIKSLEHHHTQSPLNIHQKLPSHPSATVKNTLIATGLSAAHLLHQLSLSQGSKTMDSMLFDGKALHTKTINEQAVQYYWQRNPDKQPLLSLGHVTTIHLPTDLLSSVQVKTKISLPDQEPMTVTVAFPFHPNDHYRGFQILTPVLLDAPEQQRQTFQALAPYLLQGIKQYEKNIPQPFWKSAYQGAA